jgi:PIN domain nuclease of toxin-antitoxin system
VETVIHLDTHVVVWLYGGQLEKLSPLAKEAIEKSELRVSPLVILELQYLYEIGRITEKGNQVAEELHDLIGLTISQASAWEVAKEALKHPWTRDPFDRLIVANATADQASLLSADRRIREHFPAAVW